MSMNKYQYVVKCIGKFIYLHVNFLGRAHEHIVLVHYRELSEVSLYILIIAKLDLTILLLESLL